MRKLNSIFMIIIASFTLLQAQDYPGFHVIGRHLFDVCGEKVILRGVANPNIWFDKTGLTQYPEIDITGANVVRIVWQTNGSAADLNSAVYNCIQYGMIPMVELHDATGDWSKLQTCVNYWIREDIVSVILAYEQYFILNIANECGNASVSNATFRTGYESAITQIRNAGIRVPLVIDGTDWGKNINILQAEGPYLINADPEHNLMFSVHMWWPQMYGYDEQDIIDEIAQSVNMGLPLIVGEFSQMHGECSDDSITAQNSIAYLTILAQCQSNEVGWIAWSWFGNCNPFWDMSSDGTYAELYDWGLEVAVTDPNSIQNTSVRSYFMDWGSCNPDRIGREGEFILPERCELKQNCPNPFNSGTEIRYEITTPADITLDIYDMQGRKVRTLVDNWQTRGSHLAYWNGTDETGNAAASGSYLYQITVNDGSNVFKQAHKLILIK
jgi:mannan endo-1,4-beta-mannosidase